MRLRMPGRRKERTSSPAGTRMSAWSRSAGPRKVATISRRFPKKKEVIAMAGKIPRNVPQK
jgi:hypothetical protein